MPKPIQFANGPLPQAANTTITGTIASSGGGTVTVASATYLPAIGPFLIIVDNERIEIDSISGTTLTFLSTGRGLEGTTAAAHSSGTSIYQVLSAGNFDRAIVDRSESVNFKTKFGAAGDGKIVTDGAMTNGSSTLTSATAGFTAADVGKAVLVARASSTAIELYTSIISVTNATTVVVGIAPGFTLTSRTLVIDGVRTVADGVTTADSTTVTSATAAFTAADIGKQIRISAAHSIAISGTISGFTNSTTVTLSVSATRTVSGASVTYGTNDTSTLITALEYCRDNAPSTLYIPEGMYLLDRRKGDATAAFIYSNTTIKGDGWGTILRDVGGQPPDNSATALLGVNMWSGGSSDPSTNISGILIENLQMWGTVVEDGFHQWTHLLQFNAASDVVVRRVRFYNFRGDACYIGSGTSLSTLERHNKRIRLENCVFDGNNRDTRNAISFIDIEDTTVSRCTFINVCRANMPGAIDIEPNGTNAFSIIRGIRIDNCYFAGIGGNSGIIGMNIPQSQSILTNPMRGYNITNCVMTDPVSSTLGFFVQQVQFPTDSTPRNDIYIQGNWFYNVYYTGEIEGCRGVEIDDNFFINSLQSTIVGYQFKSLDVSIINNVYKSCGSVGSYAIEIVQCDRVNIDRNYFENCGASDLSQGFIVRFTNGGGLSVPSGVTVVPQGTPGSTTRGYRIAAIRDQVNFKTTTASTTVTTTTSNATLSVTNFNRISWAADYAPGGFRVYGRTSGSELLMATVGPGVFTWDDTGTVTPSGALPGADTSAQGNSTGIGFTNNVVRQGVSNRTTQLANLAANHITNANSNSFFNNQQLGLAIAPFIDSTNSYTITTSALTVDASMVPPQGTVLLTGSTTSTAGALTISNPTNGQIITFQYVIPTTNFTYATAASMKFGTAVAHTLTAGRSDCYTMRYNGTNWIELARAVNVGAF